MSMLALCGGSIFSSGLTENTIAVTSRLQQSIVFTGLSGEMLQRMRHRAMDSGVCVEKDTHYTKNEEMSVLMRR